MPVPAGSGMPGSIDGRPRPAAAAPPRSICARVKSEQERECDTVQLTCMSGEVAMSMRRAFWRIARYGDSCHELIGQGRHVVAKSAMTFWDSGEIVGLPQ